MAHDEARDLRAAIRDAAAIQKLIRRHLARIAHCPAAGTSPRDAERTMQVLSDLLDMLEQNTRALQRALTLERRHRVLH